MGFAVPRAYASPNPGLSTMIGIPRVASPKIQRVTISKHISSVIGFSGFSAQTICQYHSRARHVQRTERSSSPRLQSVMTAIRG